MNTAECTPRDVRVMQLRPGIEEARAWNNLNNKRTSKGARSAWYMVVHNVLHTHAMLHTIRLVDTEACPLCGKQDTTLHLLTECGAGQEIWEWTRTRLSSIHRTDR